MEKCHKVELLAPAGNAAGFYGAVHAGADAVYLAGNRFGARAYAENFTTEELLEHLKGYAPEEIFIIGGESIYRQFLPYCDTAYVTKIDHAYDADTHFPNLDEMPEWEMTEAGEEQTSFDLEFVFTKYERKSGTKGFE